MAFLLRLQCTFSVGCVQIGPTGKAKSKLSAKAKPWPDVVLEHEHGPMMDDVTAATVLHHGATVPAMMPSRLGVLLLEFLDWYVFLRSSFVARFIGAL
jgi:hypothetical protein